jgi:dihydrofolate reductase
MLHKNKKCFGSLPKVLSEYSGASYAKDPGLCLIAAVSSNYCIGVDNSLPWSFPEDLNHFKSITYGHVVIMGRVTHESIGGMLPGRINYVLSRKKGYSSKGCIIHTSFESALNAAYLQDMTPFVIGGSAVYAAALPVATTIYLTVIDRVVEGDTFFPSFDKEKWVRDYSVPAQTPGLAFEKYSRRINFAA